MKLSKIASILECNFEGSDTEIIGINTLKDAKEDEVSFVSNSKYVKDLEHTKAAAVIISENLASQLPADCIPLVTKNPYWSMAILSKYFAPPIEDDTPSQPKIGKNSKVSPKAEIANSAVIGENCTILAHVYIGAQAVIGDNTVIYPSVTVYRDCEIGNNCMIHANTVIGSDGFGFATNEKGEHKKIYQNGNVVIEDDVEIGSNTSIDRAVFGSTVIKKGVRIDNLVQIGHNCEIGEYSVLVSQVGLAGSSKLGRNVVMGGQSATAGHLEIAPFSTFAARSGITSSIKEPGKTYAGFPLMGHRQWLKLQAKLARLIK
ncbi:UDP-3-O-(3-hydroxymyristoyl)glucosamine N-acyltransferase [Sulfurimonas autotrophica]|uniref:UDP-3-O-acylglucosamine N-acyltransferase n=1 Tax=Sulfurimonas autotrophica (strain ATCC BAA-671 / DSM 16294 / JCM 11897 / OK10) TaxID=563040 RepID=E0USH8_SULAO|nr:UDP-3-O-(3-hydroxymyristoyl)glucosamine N-acyltransferase [Sulfurimonas autotrophica]ADN09141.1 UDP-3-O-(3-hydroxymyristoyl) glucosamine N-acyltransferase [Sulfurimonas autotrophica DSM 16294]